MRWPFKGGTERMRGAAGVEPGGRREGKGPGGQQPGRSRAAAGPWRGGVGSGDPSLAEPPSARGLGVSRLLPGGQRRPRPPGLCHSPPATSAGRGCASPRLALPAPRSSFHPAAGQREPEPTATEHPPPAPAAPPPMLQPAWGSDPAAGARRSVTADWPLCAARAGPSELRALAREPRPAMAWLAPSAR
nr:brain acid soluble protein 1-like [Marmota flaviventris]